MAVVKSSELRVGWKVLLPWLAGFGTLVYVCSRFVPWAPPSRHGEIEDSYIQFLHTAFVERLQFGRDVVLTFGPWGFLYGGYHPATHLVSVIAWLGLSVVFCWSGWLAARHFARNGMAAWLWLMVFAAVAGLPIFTLIDARLKALVILLWLLHFFVENRSSAAAQASLAVALGLFSLVKFNVLIETAMVVGVIALDDVVRRRRFPWLLTVYCAAILFFWVAGGQRWSALGPFLWYSSLLASGYTEAMMLAGPKPVLDACGFLLASGIVCAVAGYAGWVRHRWFGVFPLAVLGLILFTDFKHGYVRQDAHEAAATLVLLLVSLASLAVAWPIVRTQRRRAAFASLLPVIAAFSLATSTFSRYYEKGLPAQLLGTFNIRNVLAPAKLLLGTGYLREGFEAYLADIRKDSPLPAFQGDVDTYPGNAGAILAQGLTYCPRPIMQSYQVYTPELAELNAAFLRSDRAPANIVFQLAPVDDHFPSLEDGQSWPELLTRYDVRQVEWPFVLLKRSVAPRPWRLEPLADMPIGFGELVAVPPVTNGPVWARIDIDQTLAGKIVSMLYKPPILRLTVTTRDGGQVRYRLVPGMARSGFLLSPVIRAPVAFGSLAEGGELVDLADKQATSMAISADTGSGSSGCYRSPLRLRFYRLDYPGQDMSKLEGFRALRNLSRTFSRAISLRADYPPEMVYLPRCGSVLRVAPTSAIQLSIEGHPQRLQIGFGLLAPEGMALAETNGVVFRISAVSGQGDIVPLWSQSIEPPRSEAGPGRQRAVIDLSRCPSSELILETVPGGSKPNRLQCYWSDAEFE